MSKKVDTYLVIESIKKLKATYSSIGGCLLHSDRGATYTSKEFFAFVKMSGCKQSMSRKGNCYDNAIVENFFGTFKNESIYKDTLKNGKLEYKEMEKVIVEFIDYYNNRRTQKGLAFMSPYDFKIDILKNTENVVEVKY